MANIASVSHAQMVSRRKKLQRTRQIKSCQAIWRSLLVGGMASSLIWAITLPDWVISQPEQIIIEGNSLLSKRAIRSLLPLSYPQSLLRVEPQNLAASLESQVPIAEATVSRQLVPPGLKIRVKERLPVAIAQPSFTQNTETTNSGSQLGLLDEGGVWMPAKSYSSLEENLDLPKLKIIGSWQQYRPHWKELYQAVSRSPIQVFEIDWQNPDNLILKTDLGDVHFGPYTSRFTEQLGILDRMRELPTHVQPSQMAYIDLNDPDFPAIQMTNGNELVEASN
ncbi:MAG: FtsQ-type POTRA domain-containing protein [Symploca sp. SIO3C6]|nr:FtsQ-type POTRA domain-containing protein [Symploca sp. SIO3C6]NET06557.1 FtsQ-type POTRA domain-containing protein [Symploca sp. SIO2B6]NET53516.1 FtsQ-type POTRA domain-containing protein [Merismopedia sp. SIO2A8]